MYPKVRIHTLTDGIFAVAMTILVLDLRLPEEFHPVDDGDLAKALLGTLAEILSLRVELLCARLDLACGHQAADPRGGF